jgi:hypothetical protein
MTAQVLKINHVGPLLSQHLIHIMSLTGLINPSYGAEAGICDNTQTAKQLLKLHSIPKSTHPCLVEFVGARYVWLPYITENGICKSGQWKLCCFKDVIYNSQEFVLWVVKVSKGVYRVAYLNRAWDKEGNKHVVHKLWPTYSVGNLIFEGTPEESSSQDTTTCKWWSPMAKKRTDPFSDIVSLTTTKRKRSTFEPAAEFNDNASKKARKEKNPLMKPSAPPVPSPPNWVCIDKMDIKKMVAEYERDLKRHALYKSSKSSKPKDEYGGSLASSSFSLRSVHSFGKHFTCPTRKVSADPCKFNKAETTKITGSTKNATHLMSMGVPVVLFNLHRLAERSLISSYKSCNTDLTGRLVLKVNTLTVRSRVVGTARGTTYFVPQAQIRQILPSGVKGDKESKVLFQFFLPRGAFGSAFSGILYDGIVQGKFYSSADLSNDCLFTTGYTKTTYAITSMLWYIVWTNSNPDEWLPDLYVHGVWRSPKHMGSDRAVTHSGTESIPGKITYLLLSLHNGKGKIFGTLIRCENQGVWMRLETETHLKDSGMAKSKTFVMCTTDPYAGLTSRPMVNIGMAESMERPCGHQEPQMFGQQENKSSERVDHDKENRTIQRSPLLVDPIDFKNAAEFSLMELDLNKWKSIWGDIIDQWTSTVVARTNGLSTDKFWHPPGFLSSFLGIRSKPNLKLFLNTCLEHEQMRAKQSKTTTAVGVDFYGAMRTYLQMSHSKK